jgi:hypothetical protein
MSHEDDEKTIERLCRVVCKVHGINPDLESEGLGHLMPKGRVYKLWEAQCAVVQAVLGELAVIRDEQRDPRNVERIEIETRQPGELIEIHVRPGETIRDAMARKGVKL